MRRLTRRGTGDDGRADGPAGDAAGTEATASGAPTPSAADVMLAETLARHFDGAEVVGRVARLGFAGVEVDCEVASVSELGDYQAASLFFRISGGALGTTPVFASISGYAPTGEEAIVTGGCNWACTFGPVLRAGLAGEPLPPDSTADVDEVLLDGRRFRVVVDGIDRAFMRTDDDPSPFIDDTRRRLGGRPRLTPRVLESGLLPLLTAPGAALLSVFRSETEAGGLAEVKVNGADWEPLCGERPRAGTRHPDGAGGPGTARAGDEAGAGGEDGAHRDGDHADDDHADDDHADGRGEDGRGEDGGGEEPFPAGGVLPDDGAVMAVLLRELAVLVPLDPPPPLRRADVQRTLDGLDLRRSPRQAAGWPGWAVHGGWLGEVLDGAELGRIQSRIGPLPEDYVRFLMRVAGPGAGPGYGLLAPERHGDVVPLAHAGCGVTWVLRLDGPHRGTVWADAGGSDGTYTRVASSFTDWYLEWLDAAVRDLGPWVSWDVRCCATPNVLSQVVTDLEKHSPLPPGERLSLAGEVQIRLTNGGGYLPAGSDGDPCHGCVDLAAQFDLTPDAFTPGILSRQSAS